MIHEMMAILALLVPDSNKILMNNVVKETNSSSFDGASFLRIGGSDFFKALECKDGYVNSKIDIYKHSFTEASDLYLYKVVSQFVPGVVANENNNKMSDGSAFSYARLKKGFVHISVFQYQETEYGGEIEYKAIAPISSTTTTTVSSSYGKTINSSFETKFGVSAENMATMKAQADSSFSSGVSLNLEHSFSSSDSDPFVSAQTYQNDQTIKQEAQWNFTVLNPEISGEKTYWLTSYLLFEMSNSVSYFNRDVFKSYVHYSFRGQYYYYHVVPVTGEQEKIWFEKNAFSGAIGGTNFA